jgi:hypothetical protein
MKVKSVLIIVFIVLVASGVAAQETHQSFFEKSTSINNTGMFVLGTWAVANMAVGAYGWANYQGQSKYFHQMNLFWNTVNFSIAGIALYSNFSSDITSMTAAEMMSEHSKIQRLYLINAGLDVLYVGTGFLLKHFAENNTKRQNLLKGYGNSVILQGSFLFVFDLVMYGIQHSRKMNFSENLSLFISPEINAIQLGLSIPVSF